MLPLFSPRLLLKVAIITITIGQALILLYYLATAVNITFRGTNTFVDVVKGTATQQGLESSLGDVKIRSNSDDHKGIRDEGKFFIAFSYWEQFSMATGNLLSLTALAARSGRQVVVPFVNGSKFFGNIETGTLERYYNISEFNRFLRTRGLATLVRWETFQDTCKEKLDIMLTFTTRNNRKNGQMFYPCDVQQDIFRGFKVGKAFCFDNDFRSLEILEQEVIKGYPCVGIKEWRGHGPPVRTKFPLPSPLQLGKKELHHCFNTKLEQIAQDFITNNLGPYFISMHIRLEQLVYGRGRNFTIAEKCLSEMAERVKETNAQRVFMAGDFSSFGSFSIRMVAARKHGAASLYNDYLSDLNPITFQPSLYNLTDRGSVAIVEMIILSSGKQLFMVGGGSFGKWIEFQFQEKNHGANVNISHTCQHRIPKSKRKF